MSRGDTPRAQIQKPIAQKEEQKRYAQKVNPKNFLESSKKPLDKLPNVCYNKGTRLREENKKTSPISKKGIDKPKGL